MGFKEYFSPREKEVASPKLLPLYGFQNDAVNYLKKLMEGPYPEYPMRSTVGLSSLEEKGLDLVNQYASSGVPQRYEEGMDFLAGIMNDSSDMTENPSYRAYAAESKRQENNIANQVRRGGQRAGHAPGSSTVLDKESRYRQGFADNRLGYLGNLMQQRRSEQMSAVPQLMASADYAAQMPLKQGSAAIDAGSLPRSLQQQQEDALYNKLVQDMLFEYQNILPIAQMLYSGPGQSGNVYTPTIVEKPSEFSEHMGIAKSIAGVAMPMMSGGGGGGTQVIAGGNTTPGFGTPTPQGSYYA